MKTRSQQQHTTQWMPSTNKGVLAGCAVLALAASAHAQVQDAAAGAPAAPRPSVWIEPRISAGVTLSDNGNLSSTNSRNEQTLELRPGVRAVMNTPRIQGFADYSLNTLHYMQDTSGDDLRHALHASATVNAWDNRAFVDLSGVVDDRATSAFDTLPGQGRSDANRSQMASFRISPYLRGNLAGVADYELRYGLHTSDTDAANRSDLTAQDLSLRLGHRGAGRLGWSFDASMQDVDYASGRRTRSDSAVAGLIYNVSPQMMVTVRGGIEANDVITLTRESYRTAGLGLDWRPSPRTRLNAGVDKRYFGTGHNIALEHRTGRTVWRFSDAKDVTNNPLEAASASLGSVYDLLDSLYTSLEPDPVRRAQLVQAELLRLGVSGNTQIFQNFLTSSTTLQRSQRLSVALQGVRSMLTFALARGDTSRLGPASGIGDDFDTNARIRSQSWSVGYAHRLTPLTSFNVDLSSGRNKGSSGMHQRVNSLGLGLSTRFGPRTNGSLRLQRDNHRKSNASYGETSIAGVVTHRF